MVPKHLLDVSVPIRICRRRFSSESGLPRPRLAYKNIAANIDSVVKNAAKRNSPASSDSLRQIPVLYERSKHLSSLINAARHRRALIGGRIRSVGEGSDSGAKKAILAEASSIKEELSKLEQDLVAVEGNLYSIAASVPNETHPFTPDGSESAAILLSTHGPSPIHTDLKRDHVSIARQLDLLDFENAALVTGSSWYYLKNELAILELALTNYAMKTAMSDGFVPLTTPDVVKADIASRCGFQPRDNSDPPLSQAYHIDSHSPDLVLAATSEIPLAGMLANKIVPNASLPMTFVGTGHAFRAEAGARGTDTRGLYRVHQFTKVELFAVTDTESSSHMMERMLNMQKKILDGLNIPYRALEMPSQELGASAFRKIDLEAWMPGRGSWGEVSSLSDCTDYQARRMHIRFRNDRALGHVDGQDAPLPFVHTLNGTAAAIPRLIVALLENGAVINSAGEVVGIALPKVLKPFWIDLTWRRIVHWH